MQYDIVVTWQRLHVVHREAEVSAGCEWPTAVRRFEFRNPCSSVPGFGLALKIGGLGFRRKRVRHEVRGLAVCPLSLRFRLVLYSIAGIAYNIIYHNKVWYDIA